MSVDSRKAFQTGLGLLASAVFLWLAFRGVDPAGLLDVLTHADLSAVVLAALFEILALWFRAMQWGILLGNLGTISVGPLFRATLIGYMINFVMPIRVGEVARAQVLGKETGLSRMSIFGTVVAERVLDALAILLIALLWFMLGALPGDGAQLSSTVTAAMLGLALLVVIVMGGLWVLVRHTDRLMAVVSSVLGLASKRLAGEVRWRLELLAVGFAPLRDRGGYLRLGLHSVVIWGLSVGAVRVLAAGLGMPLSLEQASFVLVALALGVSVPSGPGFVGTFHFAVVLALEAYGIDSSGALGYAILLHAVSTLPIIALGPLALWQQHLSVGGVLQEPPSDRQ